MEEGFDWDVFWWTVEKVDSSIETIVPKLPLDCVRRGVTQTKNTDLLSSCCFACKTDEVAIRMAELLFAMGYTYRYGCASYYNMFASSMRWKLYHYLMKRSGAYCDPWRLKVIIRRLDQRNIDPFLDRGVYARERDFDCGYDYQRFLKFYTHREKARIASITLIGVGKRRNRLYSSSLDVFRVISRVVWSERCDEKWSE